MLEIWRGIIGYENSYLVSNFGRIRSLDRETCRGRNIKGVLLKPTPNTHGYLCVSLYKNGRRTLHPIHKLVGVAYVGGFEQGLIINHIDEDKTNNHYSNLEWVTHKENTQHSLAKISKANEKANAKEYLVTFPCGKQEVVYNLSKFCREMGLQVSNMCHTITGHRKHHKGFKCKLLENKL